MDNKFFRTYVKINLENIVHNYNVINSTLNNAEFMAVVKANAYGCGAIKIAKTLENVGCNKFAVATVNEALELRKAGVCGDILVLGFVESRLHKKCITNNIDITISDIENVIDLDKTAEKLNTKANIHIKIDTGMSRYGFNYKNAELEVKKINKCKNINLKGIYSHFAVADEPKNDFTNTQYNRFMMVINKVNEYGIDIPIKHIANSAGILINDKLHLDMVRCGIVLYGYSPSENVVNNNIRESVGLYTRITRIDIIEKGNSISYGRTYILDKDRKIATISIGYADGLNRALSNKGIVYINGSRCNIVGKICMDACMVDVTECSTVSVGDEVEIFGKNIPILEYANSLNTINYEVLCMISSRVPRVYN